MEKGFKSSVSLSTPIRLKSTTSTSPIPIDAGFATFSTAQGPAESVSAASYLRIVVLVPNSAAFERVLTQLMSDERGLRLADGHAQTGKLVPFELPGEWIKAAPDAEVFSFGDVTVNIPEMVVRRKGRPVILALKEFRTLTYLLKNPGRVIARDELLNEVWGYQNYPCTRTVDNHILRLRQKLEAEPSNPKHLLTIHSAGYKFLP